MDKQLLPITKELTELEKDILEVISTSEISSPKQIANILDIKEIEVIAILNNDDFYSLICANSLSNMRLAYHSKAIPHLIKDLDSDVKFYDSYDRLTKAIGAVKENNNGDLKLSLEVLLKREEKEKDITPRSKSKDLNTVSKSMNEVKRDGDNISGNIFEVEDNTNISSHIQREVEFEFEEEE